MGMIRNLQYEEFDESIRLSQFAFQYTLSSEDRSNRRAEAKLENIWGYFEEDQLAAKMRIFPFHTFIQGKRFSMGGVAGVATWPEYRRKGLVAQLLIHGLHVMRQAGQTVAFLHPFAFPFYRKYGWETIVERKKYEINVNQFPSKREITGSLKRIDSNNKLQQDWVKSTYQSYAMTWNGMLDRDEAWWDRLFQDEQWTTVVYFDEENIPQGYMMYEVKNNRMNIDEFVFLCETAREALWHFISNHDSMAEKVLYTAPANDNSSFLLPNPRMKQELNPYFMGRIVDVQAFMEQYPFNEGTPFRIGLHISDAQAAWNDQSFLLTIDESGEASCQPIGKEKREEVPQLSCDISTLSTMMLGYQSPTSLLAWNRLVGDKQVVQAWECAIASRQTFLLDFF